MIDSHTVTRDAGAVAAVIAFGGVLLATVASPTFAWREHALSNLGVTSTEPGTTLTVVLFNGGLILGGLVGLGYTRYRSRRAEDRLGNAVALSFAFTMVAMAGIGLFPQNTAPHFPAAVGFYLLITLTLGADAVAGWHTADTVRAGTSALLAVGNVAVWIAWGGTGPPLRAGLAIPEILGAAIFVCWIGLSTARHHGLLSAGR